MIIYRDLKKSEIIKIKEIDRSEIINNVYYYKNKSLSLEKEHYDMKRFPDGELEDILERQYKILKNIGCIFGAFENNILIGVTSVENKIRGLKNKYIKMDILFVSNKYRKKGIGKKLLILSIEKCRELGGEKLYISATPSENTVRFYMINGAILTNEVDPELLLMEPEDIHLELSV